MRLQRNMVKFKILAPTLYSLPTIYVCDLQILIRFKSKSFPSMNKLKNGKRFFERLKKKQIFIVERGNYILAGTEERYLEAKMNDVIELLDLQTYEA